MALASLAATAPNVPVTINFSFGKPLTESAISQSLVALGAGVPTAYLLTNTVGDQVFTLGLGGGNGMTGPPAPASTTVPPASRPPLATPTALRTDVAAARAGQKATARDMTSDSTQQLVELADSKNAATGFDATPLGGIGTDDPTAPAPAPEAAAIEDDLAAANHYAEGVRATKASIDGGIVASAVAAEAYPGQVLEQAAQPNSTLVGASPDIDGGTSSSLSRLHVLPFKAQHALSRIRRANLAKANRAQRKAKAQPARTARRAAAPVKAPCDQSWNHPCRWAPDRYQAGTGWKDGANASGLNRKFFNGYVRWTQDRLLKRYLGRYNGRPFGFEFGGYPTETENKGQTLWSDDWSPEPKDGGPKWENGRRWMSNLPDPYLDNLACDVDGCDWTVKIPWDRGVTSVGIQIPKSGRPSFAIGTPAGNQLKKGLLYNARYYTNFGHSNSGHVTVEAQLTSYGKDFVTYRPWGYCAVALWKNLATDPARHPADCWFAHKDGNSTADIPEHIRLRYRALWRCNPGAVLLNCARRATYGKAGEQRGIRASVDPADFGANASADYFGTHLRATASWGVIGSASRAVGIEMHVWDQSGREVTSNALSALGDELDNPNPLHEVIDPDDDLQIATDELRSPMATFAEHANYGRPWLVGICYKEGDGARPVFVQLTDPNGQRRNIIRTLDHVGDSALIDSTPSGWTGPQPQPGWCAGSPPPPPPADKPAAVTEPSFRNCETGPYGACTTDPGVWSGSPTIQYAPILCDSAASCDGWVTSDPTPGAGELQDQACRYSYPMVTVIASNAAGAVYFPKKGESIETCNS